MEISSKKPVSSFRNVFQVKKNAKTSIDPRFNPAMGEYKPEMFRKNFSFVNDIRKNELKVTIYALVIYSKQKSSFIVPIFII